MGKYGRIQLFRSRLSILTQAPSRSAKFTHSKRMIIKSETYPV